MCSLGPWRPEGRQRRCSHAIQFQDRRTTPGDNPLRSRAASSPRSAQCTDRLPDWQESADRDGLTVNRCRMAVATLLYKRVVLGWKRRPILAGQGKKRSHSCKSAPTISDRSVIIVGTTAGQPLGHLEHLQHQVLSVGELSTGSHLTNHVGWGLGFSLISFQGTVTGLRAPNPTKTSCLQGHQPVLDRKE